MIHFRKNVVLEKSVSFSLNLINYVELLEETKKFVQANQLLKSGTSIGANIAEAQNAESRPDFIHKMKIACKELNETHYWLILCNESNNYPPCDYLMDELVEIEKLLNKILGTLKRKEFD